MSAKTGLAPTYAIEFAVAIKEKLGHMTSSPGPTPQARSASWSAVLQEETATANSHPMYAANFSSNSATLGPCVTQPERSTSSTPCSSSTPMYGRATGIMAQVDVSRILIWHLRPRHPG